MAIFKIQSGEMLLKVRQRPTIQIKDTWRLSKVSKGVTKTKGRGLIAIIRALGPEYAS